MAYQNKSNGSAGVQLSWDEADRHVLSIEGRECVRVESPIRLCVLDGDVVSAGYDEVTADASGWTGRGEVLGADGTRVEVVDEWRTASERSVRIDRRATVTRAGSGRGVRVELRAVAPGEGAFDDWQLFVAGALYARNDTDGDGREDYLGTYEQEYRDDRLATLAVLGYMPA